MVLEPIQKDHAPATELVQRARDRLADELAQLPPAHTPQLRARVLAVAPMQAISFGALVRVIRQARQYGDVATARDYFVLLLERTNRINQHWAHETIRRTPVLKGTESQHVREDLLQDLALRLWEAIALNGGEAWELFFQRALAYAQQHTATALMEQRGYWTRNGDKRSQGKLHDTRYVSADTERTSLVDAHLSVYTDSCGFPLSHVGGDAREFMAADLTDLRDLVARLPQHQRIAVVLRHWQQASEAEIADLLGVTSRTVRNYLRRAYRCLREWYEGTDGSL